MSLPLRHNPGVWSRDEVVRIPGCLRLEIGAQAGATSAGVEDVRLPSRGGLLLGYEVGVHVAQGTRLVAEMPVTVGAAHQGGTVVIDCHLPGMGRDVAHRKG